VLWSTNDYPALSTLSSGTTRGYLACIHCDKNPLSWPIRHKLCYIGLHRYLPMTHCWRRSTTFDGTLENQEAPGKFNAEEVDELLERVSNVSPGLHNNA
jgi:hypothetical protein